MGFFKRFAEPRCSCGRHLAVYDKVSTENGEVKVPYCLACWEKKKELERIQKEEEQIEIAKQKRCEYLKREIELAELEKNAKELGID